MCRLTHISIHAPHARSDASQPSCTPDVPTFQSTLLMRGATSMSRPACPMISYFNPRSSCEERHGLPVQMQAFSIFQSTLLMRGATDLQQGKIVIPKQISIHAPHARSDLSCHLIDLTLGNFNPRSSCEERPQLIMMLSRTFYFNPRSSCEERLLFDRVKILEHIISIHAPHARSDSLIKALSGVHLISIHAPHARSD